MASSDTEIANLALGHLGVGKEISNLETDRSQEALACKRYYNIALDTIFRTHFIPWTRKFLSLALVEEEPTTEWAYSYRYPTDCYFFKRILSGIRNDNRQSRVPYLFGTDDEGQLIYTDMEDAVAEYSLRIDDPQRFPSDFTMAFSFLLASLVAPTITNGDPFKMGERAVKMYDYYMKIAESTGANEQQEEEDPQSEFIRSRET